MVTSKYEVYLTHFLGIEHGALQYHLYNGIGNWSNQLEGFSANHVSYYKLQDSIKGHVE